jgi:2-polyprenyl-6-methoxyphenol hydroxylase-like FAD-dependent oxidoreductase
VEEPVIVVGAGPVGLVLACELARREIPVRIIDKLTAPTTQSRAIAVHARSLEMMDRIGVASTLLGTGVRSQGMQLHAAGKVIAQIGFGDVASRFPFTLLTAQTETERVLTERLAGLGVRVDRGTELVGLTQRPDGVQVRLRHAAGGREEATALYLAGADGGGSSVRRLAGTGLAGSFTGERFVLGDVEAETGLDRHVIHTFAVKGAGPLLVFPMKGRRLRVMAQIGRDDSREVSAGWLQQLCDERGGSIRITGSHWLTRFDIHHAQVPQYRLGRVFLAGDAAHIHSPAGGQGMNTGMQDAFNLGWKLALACRAEAGDALLDSYNAERHPVGAAVISFSTRLTKVSTLESPALRFLRNRAAHAATALAPVAHALASSIEEVSITYRKSPAVVAGPGHHGLRAGDHFPDQVSSELAGAVNAPGHVLVTVAREPIAPARPAAPGLRQVLVSPAAHGSGYDAVVRDDDGRISTALRLNRSARVMIRPDGYVGAIAEAADPAPLARYARLLRSPR